MGETINWQTCDLNDLIPNAYLRGAMDRLLDRLVKQGQDLVLTIDGKEGSGKSKLARQIGAYCARRTATPFGVKNIHFDLFGYMNSAGLMVKCGIKGGVNIMDESRTLLYSRDGGTTELKMFTKWMAVARADQLIHIFCIPAIHDMDKYIREHRTAMYINVFYKVVPTKEDGFAGGYKMMRGYGTMYDQREMKPFLDSKTSKGSYGYPPLAPELRKIRTFTFPDREVLLDYDVYAEKKRQSTYDIYLKEFVENEKNNESKSRKRVPGRAKLQHIDVTGHDAAE